MITHDLTAISDELLTMSSHGVILSQHEMWKLAQRIKRIVREVEEMPVFTPAIEGFEERVQRFLHPPKVLDLARGLSVIEGGLS